VSSQLSHHHDDRPQRLEGWVLLHNGASHVRLDMRSGLSPLFQHTMHFSHTHTHTQPQGGRQSTHSCTCCEHDGSRKGAPSLHFAVLTLSWPSLTWIGRQARQLDMYSGQDIVTNGLLDFESIGRAWADGVGGVVHDFYPHTSHETNLLQKYIKEKTRLGIPLLFVEECLHGLAQVPPARALCSRDSPHIHSFA